MAHKSLVGGTAYDITGGRTLVGGTGFDISKGRTLVDGTGYDIAFDFNITITSTGIKPTSSYKPGCYVVINGETVYSEGTYTAQAGVPIRLVCGYFGVKYTTSIIIDGVTVATSKGNTWCEYEYTQKGDISIELSSAFSVATSKKVLIEVTTL